MFRKAIPTLTPALSPLRFASGIFDLKGEGAKSSAPDGKGRWCQGNDSRSSGLFGTFLGEEIVFMYKLMIVLVAGSVIALDACAPTPQPIATAIPASTLVPPSPTPLPSPAALSAPTRNRPTPTRVILPTEVPGPKPPPITVIPTPNADVSFNRDVLPIFKTLCARCHGGLDPIQELNLETREGALEGGLSGTVVKPGNPAGSIMVRYIQNDFMPFETEPKLTKEQKQAIVNWIAAGALDN